MSSRLAFQTQLASIMEVLANAAVAEICKLVDDDYAVVSLQMSQCQRENKALKRKLHLLELKIARGTAERRLRDSALNSSRPRMQLNTGEKLRDLTSAAGVVFDPCVWPGRALGAAHTEPIFSEGLRSVSPDVELVEPKALLVKEEKVDANTSQTEERKDLQFIGDDEVLACGPQRAAAQRPNLQQQDLQPQSQSRAQIQNRRTRHSEDSSSRGVEVSGSSPLLKCELSDPTEEALNPQQYVDDDSRNLQFEMSCYSNKNTNSLVEEFFDEPSDADTRKPACSYSMAAADFPSTSSRMNGWTRYGPGVPPSDSYHHSGVAPKAALTSKEKLFVCNYCGKAFNRPKKVEIHKRVHTGEKPFSCSTCGKMFSEAGNLRKHQRVHTGEKPYTCAMCGKGFAWIRNLKAHQQRSHPEVCLEESREHK